MFSSINLCTELCHHLNVMNKTYYFSTPFFLFAGNVSFVWYQTIGKVFVILLCLQKVTQDKGRRIVYGTYTAIKHD